MLKVLKLSGEWGDRVHVEVSYQNEEVPTYTERNVGRMASYLEKPPAKQTISNGEGKFS